MPRRDRTGPRGTGPLTGLGSGDCGDQIAGRFSRGGVGGWGHGPGRGGGGGGRAWRHRFWATGRPKWMEYGEFGSPTPGRQGLEHEIATLESELERLRARLRELRNTESD